MTRIEQLAALIAEMSSREGSYGTAIAGLYLSKFSTTTSPRNSVDRAVFCVVAQGMKSILVNNKSYLYDPSKYLVVSLELPAVGEVVAASRDKPFLGVSILLDFAEIGSLIIAAGDEAAGSAALRSNAGHPPSFSVSALDEDLLDAVIRLTCLLKKPGQIAIMAPLIRREIYYKLLLSEQSGFLCRMAAPNSQARRIAAGVEWLKKNATRPVRMDELAREVNMSPSTMHSWFKMVTTMSPLQFQKQLRLQEARRLLLSGASDAASVSQRVGYESPSQFSREYRRLFGNPPLRDMERLRSLLEGRDAR